MDKSTAQNTNGLKTAEKNQSLLAILIMMGACAFIASTTLIAKALGTDTAGPALHPLQISAGRFVFALSVISCVVAYAKPAFTNIDWKIHIGRSLSGWGGVTCMFAAATLMPLADATAISFINPIIAMLLAVPFLGETVGRWRWFAAILAFCGALILIQPGTDAFQPAALIALMAALLLGVETIFIKKLTNQNAPLTILFINNCIGAVIAVTAALFVWQTPTPEQWYLLITLGCLMACAQFCFLQSMKRVDVSLVLPILYTTLIFAGIYDYIVFSEIPVSTSIIGAAIIIASALTLAWRESRKAKKN